MTSRNDDRRTACILKTLLHKSASVLVLTSIALGLGAPAYSQQQESPSGASAKKPNVIFILADDWGWGDLGVYGHQQLRTPHLDQLARRGTLWTQFYVNASVCTPSRVAFMTGQFPGKLGVHHVMDGGETSRRYGVPDYLDPKIPNIAQLLHNAGYATAHFGKWHLGRTPNAPLPERYGFDVSLTVNSNDKRGPRELGQANRPHSSARIVDETIRFVESNRHKPLFVNLWLQDTHSRLEPTIEQMEAYPNLPKGSPRRIYYSAATEADKQIGRLLQRLDEIGLSENTIVIFSSDNGPEDASIYDSSVGSAGPFRGRKRSIYDGGVRAPLIVRWTGTIPAGRVDNQSVLSGVDFLPTICALTGVPIPVGSNLDGENMAAALRGQTVRRTKLLFWEWRFRIFGDTINRSPRLAMREGNWKLLMNPDGSRVELYDIPSDQSEVDNLASQHKAAVASMSKRLLGWAAQLPKALADEDAGMNAYPFPKQEATDK